MLAMFEQLPQVADISTDLTKYRLRAHIAKMIAKITAGKRHSIGDDKGFGETRQS